MITGINESKALTKHIPYECKCRFDGENIIQTNQSFSEYFETFWRFTNFSSHHKWNDARLLLINMTYELLRKLPILGN